MKKFKKVLSLFLAVCLIAAMTVTGAVAPTSAASDKELVVYFANWSIYTQGADAEVANLPWDKVTYINHAFFEIKPDGNGGYPIVSTDPQADIENANASGVDPSLPVNHFAQYAHFSALYPDVNIMISVGGWTKCGYFSEMANTAAGRASFIQSCIDLMNTYTWIDGIDVDWEYPGVARDPENDADQGNPVVGDDFTNYTLLLKEMRQAFDDEYGVGGKKLTVCESVNYETLSKQDCAEFHKYVDLINVMCYDMTGSYDPVTGHQSCIYNDDPEGYSVDSGIKYLLDNDVPKSKINIGSPLYNHGWGSVEPDADGNLVGVAGSAQGYAGQYKWYILKKLQNKAVEEGTPGWHYYYDTDAKASYLYNDDPSSPFYKNFLTYDSEDALKDKAKYINDNDLAGIILWEVNGDSVADDYPFISLLSKELGIYDGEVPAYVGENVVDPDVPVSNNPDPIYEVVVGDGSNIYPLGTWIYYNDTVWKSINNNSSDWPDNLPDGKWGASCWEKLFDVKKYVSQVENGGSWAWAADAGDYVFYDPNGDGVGGIYYAKAQTSNTANDAPDGIWGTNWEYVTTLWKYGAEEAMQNPVYEVVAGDGSTTFPTDTLIYYNGAIYKSLMDTANDWPDNLPDGKWGAGCWEKVFDVKKYVSQEELGYWDYAADEGEYVLYNPDGDNEADIYLATKQVSNTAGDAPDGEWGDASWKYQTTVVLYTEPGAIPDPIDEVIAGDGSTTFPTGTHIYYKNAVYKSLMDTANDWPDNLPDGKWGAGCWEKVFDVKKYVSQEELGYWGYAADEGEYVLYNPDGDLVGEIYLATQQVSNTTGDAPDGEWGDASWEYVTTVNLVYQPKYADGATLSTITSDKLYFGEFSTKAFVFNGVEYNSYSAGAVVSYNGKYYENYVDGSSAWNDGWEPDVHPNWHEITILTEIYRVSGTSRIDTAVQMSKAWESSEYVVLVNAYAYSDAMAGTPVASLLGAPMLYTANNGELETEVVEAIEALGATSILILGGDGVVSTSIEEALAENYNVERFGGADRTETALMAAIFVDLVNPENASCFVVNGYNFADAVIISSIAAMNATPIVYTNADGSLNDVVTKYINDYNKTDITIIGGSVAVAKSTEDTLKANPDITSVTRLSGATRYETVLQVVKTYADNFDSNIVVFVTGKDFPDACVASVFSALSASPLILVSDDYTADGLSDFVKDYNAALALIVGGEAAVATSTVENIIK